ncbi:hypothetical protein NEOC84_000363|uniref:hypothetical protein n=1 Tax=Neochlamydia sp. AcF84 TaxID=2315858 RepID=UPI001407D223|nr:hypothetical protein [Neochlamydia sp. AcF84]NGY94485.1 hypothetical protein [Neochlamydia sp. AcF84]
MNNLQAFYIQKGAVFAVPILHYKMEMAAQVRIAFEVIQPDCVAVELAETMQLQLLHAASRLPDISVVMCYNKDHAPIYYMCEPCDPAFEGLRSALEAQIPAYCIDLDVDDYPDNIEYMPDTYAIHKIGLENYYKAYKDFFLEKSIKSTVDQQRELFMARRLKELSFSYERILFIAGMSHIENILSLIDRVSFAPLKHAPREHIELLTLSESSTQEVMAEYGWITKNYEQARYAFPLKNREELAFSSFPPDRQKLIYNLFKGAAINYTKNTGNSFPGYNLRNIMKFSRNYALLHQQLLPDLYQLISAAKGCVDHNYAYEVWALATEYPYRRNVDQLPEIDLSIEDIWGASKSIRFHRKEKSRKDLTFHKQRKNRAQLHFRPPPMFSICSYPPEDLVIEKFGDFLKKKGTQLMREEAARIIPFSSSLEDGIDTRETIRHWHEKKLYVKVSGKPPGGVGSIVVIFDEDSPKENELYLEKFPWRTTWLGEHSQESDMAFYATDLHANVVGPGISRCQYGGFMMSYPPRRMFDIWSDADYQNCTSKAEVLLMAAIDYAVQSLVVYVANQPPRSLLKSFARRYGKKIVYIPSGQLSPLTLNKLRIFHVLDGQSKREIAGDYIF